MGYNTLFLIISVSQLVGGGEESVACLKPCTGFIGVLRFSLEIPDLCSFPLCCAGSFSLLMVFVLGGVTLVSQVNFYNS